MPSPRRAAWLGAVLIAVGLVLGVVGVLCSTSPPGRGISTTHVYDRTSNNASGLDRSPRSTGGGNDEASGRRAVVISTRSSSVLPVVAAETIEGGGGPAVAELANPETVNNAGSPIRSFVTSEDQTYYRVFSGDRTVGGFLTGAPPESSAAAIEGLALPPGNTAEFLQEVLVPGGTRLQSSIAAEAFGHAGGWLQFELLDEIPIKNFGPGVPFL